MVDGDDDLAAVPPEVLVGVVDPLVGNDTEREEEDTEGVDGGAGACAVSLEIALESAFALSDREFVGRAREVIEAYQALRKSRAFA